MKSLKTIQTLAKIGKILSRIALVCAIIGGCGCIAGLLSVAFGNGALLRLGGVALHHAIANNSILAVTGGFHIRGIGAALVGWLILCIGNIVIAKFAERYFINELAAGTPFTKDGADELQRLGILMIAIPIGCGIAASIAEGMIVGFLHAAELAAIDVSFDNDACVVLGIAFLVISLLCRYGAEKERSVEV